MKKCFFIVTIQLLCLFSNAQFKYLKQAKEAIADKKYDVAFEKLDSYLKKEGANASYLYLKFLFNNEFAENTNTIDSANFYLKLCIDELAKLTPKEKEKICKELDFCELNTSALINDFENNAFHKYCDNKNEEKINDFLDKYPNNLNYKISENLRDSIELVRIISTSSPNEIIQYLKRRPNSNFIITATVSLHQFEFDIAKKTNTIESLEAFAEKYPEAKQIQEATDICQDLAYKKAVEKNNEQAFDDFLLKYPTSRTKDDIENRQIVLIWKRINDNGSILEYNQFVQRFPKSVFIIKAKEKIEKLTWESVIKENSTELLEDFIAKFPDSKRNDEARIIIQRIKSTALPYLTTEKKYKLYNINNQSFVSDDSYDVMYMQQNGLIIVSNRKKYGVIDCAGKTIIPATYDCVSSANNSFIIKLGEKYGVVDLDGNKILPIAFDNIFFNTDSLFEVMTGTYSDADNTGLYDLSGEKVFDFSFESMYKSNDSLYILKKSNGYFISNKQGAISKKFNGLSYLKDDLFVFQTDKKYGVVKSNGKIIVQAIYNNISKLDNNYLLVTSAAEREGIIDYNGKIVLPANYLSIVSVSSELYVLDLRKKYEDPNSNHKLYNISKNEIYNNFNFDDLSSISEGMLLYSKNGKIGYIDSLVNIKVQPLFSADILNEIIEPGYEGDGGNDECYGANDYSNDLESEYFSRYDLLGNFSFGLATVKITDQYGYINTSGDIAIPIIYDMAYRFHDNVSIVAFKTNNDEYKFNIINRLGANLVENIDPLNYYNKQHFLLYKKSGYYFKINTINYEIEDLKISDVYENIFLSKNGYHSFYKGCEIHITKSGWALMDKNIDFTEYELNESVQKGIALFYSEKYSDCYDIFKSVIQQNQNHYDANLWLGKTYIKQKEYYYAKDQFNRCLKINPNNIEPLNERKAMNYEQGNWRDYIEDMDQSRNRSDYSFSANDYFSCGYAYAKINNNSEALKNYNWALSLDSKMAMAYNNRGVIYFNNGNKIQALSDYSMAIKYLSSSDNESIGLYYSNRGNVLYNLSRKTEACADFSKGAAKGNQNCMNMLRYCK